jgi:hypothetical protein
MQKELLCGTGEHETPMSIIRRWVTPEVFGLACSAIENILPNQFIREGERVLREIKPA